MFSYYTYLQGAYLAFQTFGIKLYKLRKIFTLCLAVKIFSLFMFDINYEMVDIRLVLISNILAIMNLFGHNFISVVRKKKSLLKVFSDKHT